MKNRKRYLRYKEKRKKMNEFGSWSESECPECGEKSIFFYDKYDALCCISCDAWMERACNDPNCPYCANRPFTPSEALYLEEEKSDGKNKKDWRRQNYQHKNDGKLRQERKKEWYEKNNVK